METKFDNLLIWALPGSGKSEILAFLRGLTPAQRAEFGVGDMVEIDDYPMVAESLRRDNVREERSLTRLMTHHETHLDGGFHDRAVAMGMLDSHLNVLRDGELKRNPYLYEISTLFIECARGGPADATFPMEGGYQSTLLHLKPGILEKAAILYVYVTPEQARAKNDARYDPDHPQSTLGHRVPTNVMLNYYGKDDFHWMLEQGAAAGREGYVKAGDLWLPAVALDNRDDKTTWEREKGVGEEERAAKHAVLYEALKAALAPMVQRYQTR